MFPFVVWCKPRVHLFLTSNQPCPSHVQWRHAHTHTHTCVHTRRTRLKPVRTGWASLSKTVNCDNPPSFCTPHPRTKSIYEEKKKKTKTKCKHALKKPWMPIVWRLSGCRFTLNRCVFPWIAHIYAGADRTDSSPVQEVNPVKFPPHPCQDFYLKM